MRKKWIVALTETERISLHSLVAAGRAPARKLAHARILLKADTGPAGPGWRDVAIAQALEVSGPTVARVRRRYVEEGLDAALTHRPPAAHRPRRLDGDQEAHLIALACSPPPAGRARWTLRLLADRMVELQYVATVSDQTVRRTLKKTRSSRGGSGNGASPRRRAPSSSTGWRTFSTSTGVPTTPRSR
jgi:transposase